MAPNARKSEELGEEGSEELEKGEEREEREERGWVLAANWRDNLRFELPSQLAELDPTMDTRGFHSLEEQAKLP